MNSFYVLQYLCSGWVNKSKFSYNPLGLKLARQAREEFLKNDKSYKRKETRIIEIHERVLKNYEKFYTNIRNKRI